MESDERELKGVLAKEKKEWVRGIFKNVVHSLGQETREWLAEN
jgi:hypothetical protein